MRVGMSWPAGRGRRQWISVGPVALAVLAPFWVATWTVILLLAAVVWVVTGIAHLITQARGGKDAPLTR